MIPLIQDCFTSFCLSTVFLSSVGAHLIFQRSKCCPFVQAFKSRSTQRNVGINQYCNGYCTIILTISFEKWSVIGMPWVRINASRFPATEIKLIGFCEVCLKNIIGVQCYQELHCSRFVNVANHRAALCYLMCLTPQSIIHPWSN